MNELLIGCIADDFTGASDAASFLAAGGLRTVLTSGVPADGTSLDEGVQAIVVALKSRTIPAGEAVAQSLAAARWLLGRGASRLYFKYCSTFDSTPAGNIGPVTDALLDLLDEPFTVVCPALPVNGRIVRDGLLYVHGVPLSESPMKDHPLTPMRDASICRLMQAQSRYPCHYLPLPEAGSPDDAVARTITRAVAGWQQASPRFTLVLDQGSDGDAVQIVRHFGHLRLATGGSGLLEALARSLTADALTRSPAAEAGPGAVNVMPRTGAQPRLILAGSCSDMTRRQVRSYLDAGGLAVKMSPLALKNGSQSLEQLKRQILEAGEDLLIYSSADEAEVRQNQLHGALEVAGLLETVMGQCAAYGLSVGIRRLIVAGGETSGAVTRALGYDSFYIGQSVAPGVPVMQPTSQPDLLMVLKSGNFGDPDFFRHALADRPAAGDQS